MKYSFKGALPSYLKTIAIPLFEDRTYWAGLREEFTEKVIDAFIEDNTLQVVEDEDVADLVLYGTIVRLEERKSAITAGEVVRETQIWLTVQVKCINKHTEKPLWQETIQQFGTIEGAGTLEEKNTVIQEITEIIVRDIVDKTISAW
ncbi:MAG: LptE family protein [Calditrichaeota bacterium]|nr:LptE family protein [Calditrichota bacterium]